MSIINDIENDNKIIGPFSYYYLIKNNKIFKILIFIVKNKILIKCNNYETKLNFDNLLLLFNFNVDINTIDEAFYYIINIFEDNNAIIKEIKTKDEMKLLLKVYNNNKEQEVELLLRYKKKYNNLFIEEINNSYSDLKNEINNIKEEINKIKRQINEIKTLNKDSKIKDEKNNRIFEKKNPEDIKFFKELINDSYSHYDLDNTFTVFKSINEILTLIYANKNKSIISYDISNNKKIKEIKNTHYEYITNFRYHFDNINNRDLILTISSLNNNIKLWDANTLSCLHDFYNINKNSLFSACFLSDNEQINIITSDCSFSGNSDTIKSFDLKGNQIKEINNSNEDTFFMDIYYDNYLSKNYIITGNKGYIKSYDYNQNKLFHKYYDEDEDDKQEHYSIFINKKGEMIRLIDSCMDGYIRIWNFFSGLLLFKIKVNDKGIYGICMWNEQYIFVGCKEKIIKLIELNNGNIVKCLNGHNNCVLTIKKIIHPKYGECLISQGYKDSGINLWINKYINI